RPEPWAKHDPPPTCPRWSCLPKKVLSMPEARRLYKSQLIQIIIYGVNIRVRQGDISETIPLVTYTRFPPKQASKNGSKTGTKAPTRVKVAIIAECTFPQPGPN